MSRRIVGRAGFSVTEMLVVIAIIGIMMALLLPAVQMVREAGRKTSCANNLTQIGKAIMQHKAQYQIYPTAGLDSMSPATKGGNGDPQPADKQWWGWAYQILPFMDLNTVQTYHNDAEVAGLLVPNYFCPTRRRPQVREGIDCGLNPRTMRGALDYAGNGGIGNANVQIYPASPDAWINQNGTIIPVGFRDATGTYRPAARADRVELVIPDGETYTILVGERNFNRQRIADSTQQDEDNGYIAGYSWDTIRWGYAIPAKDREDMSDFDLRFGSSHNQIAQFLLCDGAVKSLNYAMDLSVFQGLCHRNDNRSPEIP